MKLLQRDIALDFLTYLSTRELYAPCNMFVAKTSVFREICELVFSVVLPLR